MNTTNNEVIDFPDYSTGELCETTQQQLYELLIGTAMDPFRWRRNRSTPFAP